MDRRDRGGLTPLQHCTSFTCTATRSGRPAELDNSAAVVALLRRGADSSVKDASGCSPAVRARRAAVCAHAAFAARCQEAGPSAARAPPQEYVRDLGWKAAIQALDLAGSPPRQCRAAAAAAAAAGAARSRPPAAA